MLAAEALRLAAIEVLCPTAAAIAGGGFPTLAGPRVLDSRAVAIEDLDRSRDYTPVLALYTPESGVSLRGPLAAVDDTIADAVLDVVAELAITSSDDRGDFADAMADTDPEARLVLAALCAQVRCQLDRAASGGLWRSLVNHIIKIEEQTFAVPDLGLRWQRVTMRFHCQIHDDDFDGDGLPQPLRSVFEALPVESYAKAKLGALGQYFIATAPPPLEGIRAVVKTGSEDIVMGVGDTAP